MEIRKQVTKDIDIVNIASFQNLNFEFWKDENKKDLDREILMNLKSCTEKE